MLCGLHRARFVLRSTFRALNVTLNIGKFCVNLYSTRAVRVPVVDDAICVAAVASVFDAVLPDVPVLVAMSLISYRFCIRLCCLHQEYEVSPVFSRQYVYLPQSCYRVTVKCLITIKNRRSPVALVVSHFFACVFLLTEIILSRTRRDVYCSFSGT